MKWIYLLSLWFLCASFLCCCSDSSDAPPKPTSYAQTIAAVKAFIESQMSEKEIVGLSIALVDAERDDLGNVVWRQEIIQRIFWNCTSVRCKKFRKILQIIIEKSV